MGFLTIFFSEIAIWKSLKNNENKSKGAPFYDQPIARKSSSKLPVTWRHKQFWTRFPGDRLIVEEWSFGLLFIFFSSFKWLSQKKMVKNPIVRSSEPLGLKCCPGTPREKSLRIQLRKDVVATSTFDSHGQLDFLEILRILRLFRYCWWAGRTIVVHNINFRTGKS